MRKAKPARRVRRKDERPSVKVIALGAPSGVIPTGEAIARLRVKEGDILYLTEPLTIWRY